VLQLIGNFSVKSPCSIGKSKEKLKEEKNGKKKKQKLNNIRELGQFGPSGKALISN
jgi:hypothetical protein